MSRRSVLFSPGDRPALLAKAPETSADVVVFDLEDAVAPDQKAAAREAVRERLTDPEFDPDAEVCVRVNPIGEGATRDVARALADGPPDSVMLPKAASGAAIRDLDGLLGEYDVRVPILALVESAAGVLAAPEIAAASAADALVFGAEDLAADLGATRTPDGDEIAYARQRVVLAASAHGIDAIDTLVTDFEDEDRLSADAELAVTLGFDGKLAIHPAQVGPINEAFTPSEDQIAWARRVLETAEGAAEDGRGVFEVDGEMIDPPLITQAERVRERAVAADAWH